MFTGIITHTAPVAAVADGPFFKRLTVANPFAGDAALKSGDSIAVNGVCLTVAEPPGESLAFDVIQETLGKTNLGALKAGERVHLERAMKIGDRFDGHFVQGHVDATATLLDVKFTGQECRLTLQAPDHLLKYLSPKGSVALDGVSLTVASYAPPTFQVALIPTTIQLTLLAQKPPGSLVNIECDVLAKQIVTFLELRDAR